MAKKSSARCAHPEVAIERNGHSRRPRRERVLVKGSAAPKKVAAFLLPPSCTGGAGRGSAVSVDPFGKGEGKNVDSSGSALTPAGE